jgi:hypothetical protein
LPKGLWGWALVAAVARRGSAAKVRALAPHCRSDRLCI